MKCAAWLMCLLLLLGCGAKRGQITLTVENGSAVDRVDEIVEVEWKTLGKKGPVPQGRQLVVTCPEGGQIPSQQITLGSDSVRSIIFPVSISAGQKKRYRISGGKPVPFPSMTYGRQVPERKDDFTWENNRVAFRLYGPALQQAGEISNGLDFWAKRTDSLIIDKWYRNDLAGVASYHTDHGEGLDFYKVGRTLGLGMTAPFDDDSLCLGANYIRVEILDSGPLRITFRLEYAPYHAGGKEVGETRIISLDAYSQLNRVTKIFDADTTLLTLATGIVTAADTDGKLYAEELRGIMAYQLPEDRINGTLFAGVIHPEGFDTVKTGQGHMLGLNRYTPRKKYTYYTGAGWNKVRFATFGQWIDYLNERREIIDNPLKVTVE